MLLVICPDQRTARWSATPIEMGHPGWTLTPLVVGPRHIPAVTDPAQAADSPELSVLSAMAHATHPERDKIFQALLAALTTADPDHATLYADLGLAALPQAARHRLEALMTSATYECQSDFARRYFFQGEAKGEAKALLTVLEARGVDSARQRITECTDTGQLESWIRRATTIDDVLG